MTAYNGHQRNDCRRPLLAQPQQVGVHAGARVLGLQPADLIEQPTNGFQVCSVHSMGVVRVIACSCQFPSLDGG